jgi:hypothetical protein
MPVRPAAVAFDVIETLMPLDGYVNLIWPHLLLRFGPTWRGRGAERSPLIWPHRVRTRVSWVRAWLCARCAVACTRMLAWAW